MTHPDPEQGYVPPGLLTSFEKYVQQQQLARDPATDNAHSAFKTLSQTASATDAVSQVIWSLSEHIRKSAIPAYQPVLNQLFAQQQAMRDAAMPITDRYNLLGTQAIADAAKPLTQYLDTLRSLRETMSRPLSAQVSQAIQIASAQDSICRLLAGGIDFTAVRALSETVGRYAQVQAQLGFHLRTTDTLLLRGLTSRSGRRYDSYLNGLPAHPSVSRAFVAQLAGDAQSGMLIAESLTSTSLADGARKELEAEFTTTALEPWQSGPDRARRDLFEALAALDPLFPGLLMAAWDKLEHGSPEAAARTIAFYAVSSIEDVLRIIADTDSVKTWVIDTGRPANYVVNGRPTRQARTHYAMHMRNRPNRDSRVVSSQIEAFAKVVSNIVHVLGPIKHGGSIATIPVVRSWLMTTESILMQLLCT